MIKMELGSLEVLVIGNGEVVVVCEWLCGDMESLGEEFWSKRVWVKMGEGYEFVGKWEDWRGV